MKAVLYIRAACANQLIDTHQPEESEHHAKDNGYEASVFMVDCRDFFLGCLVLVCAVHSFQMIVERRTGQLSNGKKNFKRMFLPQLLNYQRFLRWRRSSSKTKACKFFK